MTIIEKIEKKFGKPDHVGQSEYRAILEVLESAETDKDLAIAICDEFVAFAKAIKQHIVKH